MNRRVFLLSVLLVAALPLFGNHAWSNYHWRRTAAQVTPPVTMNLTGAWPAYAERVMTDWNASSVVESPWSFGALSQRDRCTSANGQIEVCNESYGQFGWLGKAGITLKSGHISKAYTKLNDTYFATTMYDTPPWRRLVFCQEVGHNYGLGHVNEDMYDLNTGSCMDYTNDPSGLLGTNGPLSNEYPNAHDYAMLEQIYAHADSIVLPFDEMTADATRPTTMVESMNKAEQWGEPIAFDPQGRPTTFFLRTGPNHDGPHPGKPIMDGELLDVFWAPFDPFATEPQPNGGQRYQQ